ncbi:Calx-beta domain-containing protein [Paractinoplanes lichenicola]|uniref:Calx-beta domain-containing protein n=1 Tax=Paractinoplanes lichenicola TaxID=2802976 RepID=A0ABS1VH96_9ACTN|nr:Calx-beta domain-containing protein [Actinoplanes lichenicola]MBL7254058.1 hypothetical protein [Actinoplanes lichenicola]
MVLSAAVAAAIGVAPALVYSSPAMADPGDLVLTPQSTTVAENGILTIDYKYNGAAVNASPASYSISAVPSVSANHASSTDFALTSAATISVDTTHTTGTITVKAAADQIYEGDETFVVKAVNGSDDTATTADLTITDGDAPSFTLTTPASTTPAQEAAAGSLTPAKATVTAALPTGWTAEKAYTVNLTTLDGTAKVATDYTALANKVVTIPVGGTFKAEDVTITSDGLKDSALVEDLTVLGTGPASNVLPQQVKVQIKDDPKDAVDPVLSIAKAADAKEGTSASFKVTADHGSDTEIKAWWSSLTTTPMTGHGTATAGTDFDYDADATKRFVTVPAATAPNPAAGTVAANILIPLKKDDVYEQPEDFTIGLDKATGATVGTPASAMGTIIDEKDLTTGVTPVSIDEGNNGRKPATFTATLSQAASTPVTVMWKTTPGTATANVDYMPTSGTVTFPAGSTKQTFTVDINGDLMDEPDETFSIATSSEFVGYSPSTALITIKDDDAAPTFKFDSVTMDEGNMPHAVLLPVKLSNPSSQAISFDVTDTTGSGAGAASDTFNVNTIGSGDYSLLTEGNATVNIQAGETEGYVVVLVNGDKIHEKAEWAKFTATPSAGTIANLATGAAATTSTLTLSNDDKAPDLEINNVTGKEGETVQVTGVVSGWADDDIKLTVVFAGGASDGKRAASADDFTNPGATPWTIAKGTVEGTVIDVAKVPLLVTPGAEPAETIRVTGYGEGNVGTVTEGVITIAAHGTAPEEPGEPGEAPKPTIMAKPTKVVGPSKVEVEGTVAPGKQVQLWSATVGGGALKWVKNVTADEDGYYWFEQNITWGTRFATLSQGVKSNEIAVWVQQDPVFVVSTSTKGQLNLGVKGMPWGAGQTAAVQQWVNGAWVTKWSGKTGADGVWRGSPKFKSGTSVVLRAWVGGEPGKGTLPAFTDQIKSTVK